MLILIQFSNELGVNFLMIYTSFSIDIFKLTNHCLINFLFFTIYDK